MDVDALELQAGMRTTTDANFGVTGQAFLCDQLENGAGYCRYLGQPEQFTALLTHADPSAVSSLAAKWMAEAQVGDAFIGHGPECDTSCNLCLRDFNNLPYHGLLDWRLALDMARIAASPLATVDLVSMWGQVNNPWIRLITMNGSVPATMKRLLYGDPIQFGNLRGYVHQIRKPATIWIECHPLWTTDHPEFVNARADATTRYPGCPVEPMNPFCLIRRPADYI
jgi:hypothetical protein